MAASNLLDSLNPAQYQAVTAPLGNSLIVAGAGSGKTGVLVRRIAWLVYQHAASPYSILAVTFTNKAAAQMRSRLEGMIGREASRLWMGTFHGLSHKFLRLHWKEAGLPESFQVIDSDDQLSIIRRLFKTHDIDEDRWDPKKVQGFINRKKDEGIRFHQLVRSEGYYEQVMCDLYGEYEKICKENALVDFGELLLLTSEMFRAHPDLLAHYQARFSHFLVDEFQDTNTIQYQWLCLLSGQARSVMVVGDDDQSIYGWRGAKIENIRRFEREFKETVLIRLEQNYRSTATILSAANALISNNGNRFGKTLWTQGEAGEPITVYGGFNEEDEALFVVRQVRAWVEQGGALKEIAVLYRSNAQSRVLEESFVRAGIPYTIYGGLRFFERAEIKDALAYLRLAMHPEDNTAFERIVNMPPRGIGDRTLEKIQTLSQDRQCSYWMATKWAIENQLLTGRATQGLLAFSQVIEKLMAQIKDNQPLQKIIETAIRDSGLLLFFSEQKGEKAQSRGENLEELLNATSDFEAEIDPLEGSSVISAFLAYSALEGGERSSNDTESSVQLMTLHSAKGLEFPVVFICGLEDGLFPHHFSRENPQTLEEERRLCYVGITRAMQRLHFTYAEKRRVFGRDELRRPSRFLTEIPRSLLKESERRVFVNCPSHFVPPMLTKPLSKTVFSEPGGFCLGQRVHHPKFGEGVVVDAEGSGERARVHVRFDLYGSKWLAIAYAKLEAV